ncbi:helix-turn-helix domain-containing protein [Micromonospora rifamycinica]|uniref:Helix-turn-helix domain-containing protein n=1 Tax=Micromonospora rifamycinica TaxID=291594 RepID=A0A109II80_9ACTN|nr:helix-turn-helix transcriptional regulator [Micromonospora rifamycinica]KWV31032.1 DNA-binding protein [Micromonospora rifamycinica]SCG55468.1 Helix-turn-helix domain-containing protein [Micromonospora rifamycinica]
MSDGSSVPRRQLGRLLRQAREEAGINLEAAAEALEWSRAKMYRLEGGQTSLRTHDVTLMCQHYGTSTELTEVLVSLARESKSKGWWHAYGEVIPAWFELYVGLEAAARRIRHYETMLIPGLLQSPEYMAAVFESKPGRAPQEVARKVSLRLERQRLLSRRRPVAPTFEAIIDEAVIRRPIADVEEWRKQLAHLVNAAQAPNVSVRIVPQSAGPHMVFVANAFIILDFPALGTRPAEPSTVYSESLTGSLYLDRPNELETYSEAWQALSALALDERESEDLIGRVIKETYDE